MIKTLVDAQCVFYSKTTVLGLNFSVHSYAKYLFILIIPYNLFTDKLTYLTVLTSSSAREERAAAERHMRAALGEFSWI